MAKDYIEVNMEDIIKYARKASLEDKDEISAKLTQYFAPLLVYSANRHYTIDGV